MIELPNGKIHAFSCKTCADRSCAIAELNDKQLELLSENITETSFDPGDVLFKQGALNAHIIYIKKGLVKIHVQSSLDKDCILKIVPAPTYLGLPTIFGDSINRYSATALEPTRACFLDVDTFKQLIYTNGKFAYEIIADVSRDELCIFNRCANQMHKQIPGRLAEALLFFVEKVYNNAFFVLPLTKGELGAFIGTSRESVTRQLKQFMDDGILKMDKNKIEILNLKSLKRIYQAG